MTYRLKDLCSISKGATGIMKADGGKFPLVALGEERKMHSEYQFDAKAVIVPLISSTGHGHASMKRVHYQEGKFALGNILCAVIPNDETQLNAKYLHLYLQQFKETLLVSLMRGAANVSLPMNKLADVEIEVPSLERQLEIIALEEEAAEYKNELEERLIGQSSNIVKLRQALLCEAMQGKLVQQDAKDGHAKDLLEKIKAEKAKLNKKEKPLPPIKEDEIPFDIPENWVWCRLGEICLKVTDGFHNTPKKLSEGKIYISATHIREHGIKWSDCLYVSEKDHQELFRKAYPKKGEILITNRGAGCATPAIIDIDEEFSFQNAALVGFNQELISSKFIFYFILKSRDEIMQTFVNGGLQPMLSNVVLSTIPIPFPPLPEQNRIVKKLEQLMQLCDELQATIKNSKEQNEQLLQQVLREALRKE
jgi:type I restriction enzyme S subunit